MFPSSWEAIRRSSETGTSSHELSACENRSRLVLPDDLCFSFLLNDSICLRVFLANCTGTQAMGNGWPAKTAASAASIA
jgi:hypothetical protein